MIKEDNIGSLDFYMVENLFLIKMYHVLVMVKWKINITIL
jgi:hypothetical protein